MAQSESFLKSEEYPDICSIETKKCSKWRWLEVTRHIGDSCAYLFSNSLWFRSVPEGFFCIACGGLASLQKPLAGPASLGGMDGFSQGTSSLWDPWCKGSFESFSPCYGTADPESSLSGIPPFPDMSHFCPGPLPVNKARLGFNSFSRDFREPRVSAMRENSACKTWELSDPRSSTAGGAAQQTLQQTRQKLKGE